jgi:hypothetical protein
MEQFASLTVSTALVSECSSREASYLRKDIFPNTYFLLADRNRLWDRERRPSCPMRLPGRVPDAVQQDNGQLEKIFVDFLRESSI